MSALVVCLHPYVIEAEWWLKKERNVKVSRIEVGFRQVIADVLAVPTNSGHLTILVSNQSFLRLETRHRSTLVMKHVVPFHCSSRVCAFLLC